MYIYRLLNKVIIIIPSNRLHPDSKFEYRECFDITSQKKFYPTDIPSFRCTHRKLESNCQKLIKNLLKLLALSLKLEDPDYFIKCCCHLDEPEVANECDFSMIHYPPILSDTVLPPDTVRCAEHTDYEIMTLLFQNQVGGLEVKFQKVYYNYILITMLSYNHISILSAQDQDNCGRLGKC